MADESKSGKKIITVNRRARRDYEIEDTFEAGIALVGSEVKSLRDGKCHLSEAYANFVGDELFLIGAHIAEYQPAGQFGHDPTRSRKLLLHRHEIDRLIGKIRQQGRALVPLEIYFRRGMAKVLLGVGRGKKHFDKRDDLAARDAKRDIERALKDR